MRFLSLVFLSVFLSAAASAADWEVASNKNGLTLYTRKVEGQDLKDFRGVVRIKATMREVVAALMDVNAMPEWFFNMQEARLLEVDGPKGSFLYFVIKGMGPVSARDVVAKVAMEQNPQTFALTMSGIAAPDYLPRVKDYVRIPRLRSGWIVTPISAHETEVRMDGNADPGGRIPVWMANLVVVLLPEKTLENLRERLEKKSNDVSVLSRDARVAKLLTGIKFPEFPQ